MQRFVLLLGLVTSAAAIETRAESDAAVGFAYSLIVPRTVTPEPPAASPATATMQQLDRIRELSKATAWPREYATSYLASLRAGPKKTFSEMSGEEADRLIKALEKYQAAKSPPKPQTQPEAGGCANGSCGPVPVRRGWFR